MEWIFVIALFVAIGYLADKSVSQKVTTETTNYRKKIFNDLGIKNNVLYSNNAEYLGGSPNITQNVKCYIDQLDNKDIIIYTWEHTKDFQYTILEHENIKSIQIIDKTQIVNNPKLSSILLFGVAGLAIGNKDKKENYYINIEYQNTNIVLGCKTKGDVLNSNLKQKATNLYSQLNKSVLNA